MGKVFCKIRLVERLDRGGILLIQDNVFTLNELVQGRLREKKHTYADVQRHDGLWLKLWDLGVKGRMWHVIKKMYEVSRSAVLLEGGPGACRVQ